MKPSERRRLIEGSVRELVDSRHTLPGLWGRQEFWQIKARWAVAPLMIVGLFIGRAIGFEFRVLPIVLIAIASPLYNAVFAWLFSRFGEKLTSDPGLDRAFTLLEIGIDYLAMFLLIYFTGGVTSPLVVFLIFHVIIAAIQYPPRTAYQLATLAAAGLWMLLLGDVVGWLPCDDLAFRGEPIHSIHRPPYSVGVLFFFTATLFLSANMVSRIMKQFRSRVRDLAEVTAELAALTDRLNSLYAMVGSIGAERRLEPMLTTVTRELARVMEVPAVAVKLLAADAKTLRYVAAHGLPSELIEGTVIEVERSPLNRRILEGETLVQGVLGGRDVLHLEKEFEELGIRSAILAPLEVEERVIGTLGIYARRADRFDSADSDFLKLAAGLVAIGIEDARADEEVERLIEERTQFMLQVAHNLRAPLSAGLSMLELVRDGYIGEINPQQAEQLQKIDDRLRSLDQTIGELLSIAKTRDRRREIRDVVVDLGDLARLIEMTFREQAERKGVGLRFVTEEGLPKVESGGDLLRQILENLVSNAIKYTPDPGTVEVRIRRHTNRSATAEEVEIEVRDSGIGIPAAEQHRLFQEFFRASNAKQLTSSGTGLGLVLVKQAVERHNGRLELTSAEGEGTTVTIHIPVRQAARVQADQKR